MSNYQLIAFDMDGTLLDSGKRILPGSLEMIRKAAAAGKTVCLSTGRCPAELTPYAEELKAVRFIISTSGALVYTQAERQVIFSQPLPEDAVRTILEAAEGKDLMLHLLGWESTVPAACVPRMEHYHIAVYRPMYEQVAVKLENITKTWLRKPFPVYKVNLYCAEASIREELKKELEPLGICLVNAEAFTLECNAPGVTKGRGLKELCTHLGIPPEETIAVGDADNDLDILSTVGLAVAMGNANEHVKAVAGAIVADNDHGGCAEAIRKYLLEE